MSPVQRLKTVLGILMCVAMVGCGAQEQEAGRLWYVNKDVSAISDGLSWESAFTHPQDALDAARAGDRVWVAAGSYTLKRPEDKVVLRLREGVTVLGGFAGNESLENRRDPQINITVLDGESRAIHVVVGADEVHLDGFTITGGNANGLREESTGGGMFMKSSSFTVQRCDFVNNSAGLMGGGLYNEQSSPTLIDCVFRENSAPYGGAIGNYSASATVVNTKFTRNTSSQNGGAVSNYFSSPEFINCAFSGNRTTFSGGAVFNYNGEQTFTNCTFTGNRSAQKGGGIGSLNSELKLTNCILWKNSSPEHREISAYESSTTVIYSNVDGGYQGTGNDDCCPGFVKDGSWDEDNWVEGDYKLTDGSPCVDSGTDEGAPDFDMEWEPRPQAQSHDKGAYEYRP